MKLVLTVFAFLVPAGCATFGQNGPVVGEVPQETATTFTAEPDHLTAETWIEGLVAPWSLKFLGDGRALLSDRPGRVRLIENGALVSEPYLELDVAAVGEGRLMGFEVHPEFPAEPYIYAMYTYRSGLRTYNRVQRFRDRGRYAEADRVIIDAIPGSRFHDGGRLAPPIRGTCPLRNTAPPASSDCKDTTS